MYCIGLYSYLHSSLSHEQILSTLGIKFFFLSSYNTNVTTITGVHETPQITITVGLIVKSWELTTQSRKKIASKSVCTTNLVYQEV